MNLNRLSRFSRAINGTGRESSGIANARKVSVEFYGSDSRVREPNGLSAGVHNGSDGLFVKVTKFTG